MRHADPKGIKWQQDKMDYCQISNIETFFLYLVRHSLDSIQRL